MLFFFLEERFLIKNVIGCFSSSWMIKNDWKKNQFWGVLLVNFKTCRRVPCLWSFAYVCCEEPAKICESGEKHIGISCGSFGRSVTSLGYSWFLSSCSCSFMGYVSYIVKNWYINIFSLHQYIQNAMAYNPKFLLFFSNSSIRNFGLYAIAVWSMVHQTWSFQDWNEHMFYPPKIVRTKSIIVL